MVPKPSPREMKNLFENRTEAGRRLGERLLQYEKAPDAVVLAIPRGGVPVGFEVASRLHLPLDVVIVRKLGFPGREELAFGAVASGGFMTKNPEVAALVDAAEQGKVIRREQREIEKREERFRGSASQVPLEGKVVILVDDGLATGASMRVAIQAVKHLRPKKLIVAVPVGPFHTCEEMRLLVDELLCLEMPEPFFGVGLWYDNFSPVSDDEVVSLLQRAGQRERSI